MWVEMGGPSAMGETPGSTCAWEGKGEGKSAEQMAMTEVPTPESPPPTTSQKPIPSHRATDRIDQLSAGFCPMPYRGFRRHGRVNTAPGSGASRPPPPP